jgi:hypothetical protein
MRYALALAWSRTTGTVPRCDASDKAQLVSEGVNFTAIGYQDRFRLHRYHPMLFLHYSCAYLRDIHEPQKLSTYQIP